MCPRAKIWSSRGLNPGPTACGAATLPLSYNPRLCYQDAAAIYQERKFLDSQSKSFYWSSWGLNPGPSACKAGALPLRHSPLSQWLSNNFVFRSLLKRRICKRFDWRRRIRISNEYILLVDVDENGPCLLASL